MKPNNPKMKKGPKKGPFFRSVEQLGLTHTLTHITSRNAKIESIIRQRLIYKCKYMNLLTIYNSELSKLELIIDGKPSGMISLEDAYDILARFEIAMLNKRDEEAEENDSKQIFL